MTKIQINVMIRFSVLISLSVPFGLWAPPVFCFVNNRSAPTASAPSLQQASLYRKHTLLECVDIEINRSSSFFNCSLKASLQKQWSSSQSLNSYVYVNAQFLQTNEFVYKFCNDCLASRCSWEGSWNNKSIFQSFGCFSNKHQSPVPYILLFLKNKNKKKRKEPCP